AYLKRVMKAQVNWVAEARAYEQAKGLPPKNFTALETGPCMTETPLFGYCEPIELERVPVCAPNPPLLYVFLPTDVVESCVEHRNLEAVPTKYFPGVVLAMDLWPYNEVITSKSIASKYHDRWCSTVEREHIKSFLAIFPTSQFTSEGNGVWTRCITRGHFDIVAHGQMIWPSSTPATDWPSASGWD
ncbi:RolB family protein, partial [Mesorhizobium sp. M7A.F.Ca.MR.362.00.0.0]